MKAECEIRERVNKPGAKQANLLCGLGVIKSVGLSGNRPQSQQSSSGTVCVCVCICDYDGVHSGGGVSGQQTVGCDDIYPQFEAKYHKRDEVRAQSGKTKLI